MRNVPLLLLVVSGARHVDRERADMADSSFGKERRGNLPAERPRGFDLAQ